MFDRAAEHHLALVDTDLIMKVLSRIAEYDRYQASQGINAAAEFLAQAASDLGLPNVRIDHFPADGTRRWWTFDAPVSWTPTVARLAAVLANETVFEIDHALQPFSLATYSAPTASGGLSAPFVVLDATTPHSLLRGAVVLVPKQLFHPEDLAERLVAGGAAGFVTDGPCCDAWPGGTAPGRIELSSHAPLFGFSLTTERFEALRLQAERGATAHVEIEIDRRAPMPVVHGLLEGERDEETLLTAHLCHPRPGANDNASGVAAVLGVAKAKLDDRDWRERRGRGGLRFQWGPEFLGTIAMLHAGIERQAHPLPSWVINLDMVGEDQALCGGPFVVERSPDTMNSRLNAVAEGVVGAVFDATAETPGVWRSAPFLGYSDHAMFADPKIDRPAVQLCHYPDRFNHSAADALDKVSPVEMRRATAAAAAIASIMARTPQSSAAVNGHCEAARPGGLVAAWLGPLNLRAMAQALPKARRERLLDAIRADKFNLALLFNFAIRADGRNRRGDLVRIVSQALGRPIDMALANGLMDDLVESGWIREV